MLTRHAQMIDQLRRPENSVGRTAKQVHNLGLSHFFRRHGRIAAGKPGVAELVELTEPEWIDPGGLPARAVAQLTADCTSAASRAKPRSGKQS